MKGYALILVLLPLAASAATITVTTTADNIIAGNGTCTLREAIANVNAAADTTGGDCAAGSGAGDTITFSVTLPAILRLAPTLGELGITKDMTILGPGAGSLAIDGRNRTRVFHITAGSTVMSDLTIQKGRIAHQDIAEGGGILNDSGATLEMTNCTVRGNKASGIGEVVAGGGIGIEGTAVLTNCTLRGNQAISHTGLPDALGGSAFGGGIEVGGTATLTNCTLRGNRAIGYGEVADIGGGEGIGGGIDVTGTATLTNCTLSGNHAIGYGSPSTSNSLSHGGGIEIGGAATLTNSTLTHNTALSRGGYSPSSSGGGIEIGYPDVGGYTGIATLTNCTLSGNHAVAATAYGSGIDNRGIATLTNTIVANSGHAGNCDQALMSGGHNLSSDDTCFTGGGTDRTNTKPRLAPLHSFGGPTQTMALCTGRGTPAGCTGASPAIDAGDDSVTAPPDNLTTDQRGLPRPSGAHVDIGAYEVQ